VDATTAEDSGETAVAFVGDLAESATASGQVSAQREAALSLATSGVVNLVEINVGDAVAAGDVLVQLETAALARSVTSAEQGVAIAEADLAKLLTAATAEELTAAEAAVLSAQAKLDALLAGPTAEEIAASEAGVKAAQANTWSASGKVQAANTVSDADILAAEKDLQEALDSQQAVHDAWVDLAVCEENADGTHTCTPKVDNERMDTATEEVQVANAQVAIAQAKFDELRNPDSNSVASSQAGWSSASAQYDAAVARHEALLLGATESEIASAEADLASAKASLDGLLAGPSTADLKIYETRLAQAETALQEAQNRLSDATLIAPFDGVVTAIHATEGENASGLAAELVDNSSLEVILAVDEIDVGRMSLGQPAIVTMETWPDEEIDSEITAIAPTSSDSASGVVTYNVHLALDQTDLPILVGMTANADLITDVGENVLLVPNAAVTADRQKGTYSVNLVGTAEDGSRTTTVVEITIGLKDDEFTQIVSGLDEGDVVLLGSFSAPIQRFGPGGNGDQDGGPGF
jgi:multidrug efflux pump subunit AcrA (membrane-fusion protein)